MSTRQEVDSMGTIEVNTDRYWGAQTQRLFKILKLATSNEAASDSRLWYSQARSGFVNAGLGLLAPAKAELIQAAAKEVIAGDLDDHFPLVVFQTGSGTQTNMNVNEVISNRAIEMAGGAMDQKSCPPQR